MLAMLEDPLREEHIQFLKYEGSMNRQQREQVPFEGYNDMISGYIYDMFMDCIEHTNIHMLHTL